MHWIKYPICTQEGNNYLKARISVCSSKFDAKIYVYIIDDKDIKAYFKTEKVANNFLVTLNYNTLYFLITVICVSIDLCDSWHPQVFFAKKNEKNLKLLLSIILFVFTSILI